MGLENVSEISLTREMISAISFHLGHEERIRILLSSDASTSNKSSLNEMIGEQLSEQLLRDGIFILCSRALKLFIILLALLYIKK